jgi:hypothetical protein
MSGPHPRRLPARPSLEQLRKQAKELSRSEGIPLAAAQLRLARSYGFESWPKLVHHVAAVSPSGLALYDRLATRLAAAYTTGDFTAIREINWELGTSFVWDRDVTQMQQRLSGWFAAEHRTPELATDDARRLIARQMGLDTWDELVQSLTPEATPPGAAPGAPDARFYRINPGTDTIEVHGPLPPHHWDTVADVIRDRRVTGVRAAAITDEGLDRITGLDQITRLFIEGGLLTDAGMRHLARLPRLEELELGGPKGAVTDRGLEVLRHLTELRRFQCCWTPGITDAGVAYLSFCDRLEQVNLMGTPTGDGAINALRGKRYLRHLKTGRLVTDAGLPLLHDFPVFKTWQGGTGNLGLMSFDSEPNHLLLDGPFTDKGLENLHGLNGVYGLSFFWHVGRLSPDSLHILAELPHLEMLGCDGKLCNDVAMRHIAAIPGLRGLVAQGTVATDDGFTALARSRSIEYIWGRECPNLKGRGFAALATMPALVGLGVSCKHVDDAALSTLPSFPSLRQLMPMDVSDDGFRHVGACAGLEKLWCMYCRDTGDVATGHLGGLSRLQSYYAGKTRITDRSLELLGHMTSLEELEFWEVAGITNAGLAALAGLPRLRRLEVGGSPNVTREGFAAFPTTVRIDYW